MSGSSRMRREVKTVKVMVTIYCHAHHNTHELLCPECRSLLEYSLARIDLCPLKDEKTTCAKCHIHCYEESQRERIRQVMRYAGPRMIYRHPVLAIAHMTDGRRG